MARRTLFLSGIIFMMVTLYVLGYYTSRNQSLLISILFISLAALYILLVRSSSTFNLVVLGGIVVRLIFLLCEPFLSEDVYRFLWDAHLWHNGLDIFQKTPAEWVEANALPDGFPIDLYTQINSKEYFTIYPWLHQTPGIIAVKIAGNNHLLAIIIIRILLISMDLGVILIIKQISNNLTSVSLYAFNPLIILEITGNLHFEGAVVFFVLLAYYFLHKKRTALSGISYAAAIATKLHPAMLGLPFLFLTGGRWWQWLLTLTLATLIFFLPFMNSSILHGMTSSIELYFNKFEFNASIYYIIREIGYCIKGYNVIGDLGPALGITSLFVIVSLSLIAHYKKWPVFLTLTLIYTSYYLLSTTIHPWYIIIPLSFSLLTSCRFGIIWSILVLFTYVGYSIKGYNENYVIIFFEYLITISWLMYELFYKKDAMAATSSSVKCLRSGL